MNKAATEDVTATQVWPVIHAVLASGQGPERPGAGSPTSSSRRGRPRAPRGSTRDLDGKIDDPGAAILDVAFTKMATAALGARLGRARPTTWPTCRASTRTRRAATGRRSAAAGTATSTRTCARCSAARCAGRFALSYCGRGSLARCSAELWAALDAADQRARRRAGRRPARVARRRDEGADQVHAGPDPGHDAVDEPADLPAGAPLRRQALDPTYGVAARSGPAYRRSGPDPRQEGGAHAGSPRHPAQHRGGRDRARDGARGRRRRRRAGPGHGLGDRGRRPVPRWGLLAALRVRRVERPVRRAAPRVRPGHRDQPPSGLPGPAALQRPRDPA